MVGERSRVESTFEAYGLTCAVLTVDMGHRCGYVKVPGGHPWFGLAYWDGVDGHRQPLNEGPPFKGIPDHEHPDYDRDRDTIESVLEVHGGITFDGERPNEDCEKGWWFGFDCAHLYDQPDPDLMSEAHRSIHEEHRSLLSEHGASVKSREYVERECRLLAAQIVAAAFVPVQADAGPSTATPSGGAEREARNPNRGAGPCMSTEEKRDG